MNYSSDTVQVTVSIDGALSSVQIRELFARLRYLNESIRNRPKFYSYFTKRKFKVFAKLPRRLNYKPDKIEKTNLFKLMHFYIGDIMPKDLPNREELLNDIITGRAQYIFDERNTFFQHQSWQDKYGTD